MTCFKKALNGHENWALQSKTVTQNSAAKFSINFDKKALLLFVVNK